LRHRGERLRAEDITLLTDVARRAGALVQAATLITDLQESRERLVSAREEERRRLRRDLHDGVGPELAGMALQLESLAHRSQTDPELADRARRLRDRMRSTVTEVRRLVDDLRPPALDELGLSGALREHFTVYDGVDVVVEQGAPLSHLPAATEVAAYRIASEAVANAVRHGRATSCRVCVAPGDDGLLVEVRDDGCGISADARPGVGLSSMRERATEIGGRFELTTGSEGTTVRAVLPLDAT
jgi:signal transduction histidine kinase